MLLSRIFRFFHFLLLVFLSLIRYLGKKLLYVIAYQWLHAIGKGSFSSDSALEISTISPTHLKRYICSMTLQRLCWVSEWIWIIRCIYFQIIDLHVKVSKKTHLHFNPLRCSPKMKTNNGSINKYFSLKWEFYWKKKLLNFHKIFTYYLTYFGKSTALFRRIILIRSCYI